jgi:RNA-directed DNA polymerase
MRGWRSYFGFCETPEVLIVLDPLGPACDCEPLCGGNGKHHAVAGRLCWNWGFARGWPSNTAGSGLGPWYLARAKALSVGLSNAHFKSLGLPTLIDGC